MSILDADSRKDQVSNDILTPPNVISFLRLCLVPLYFVLLFNGLRIEALIVFAIASITDFLDGYIARKYDYVSRIGQLLDPAIDTILMISGVVGVWLFCGLPTWVMFLIFLREASLLVIGACLIKFYSIRIPVVYLGKVATALLFFGICSLFLVEWGIFIIYIGLALQIIVTIYYLITAIKRVKEKRAGRS